MTPDFTMLIFDENGKCIRVKDPVKFISRRAKMKDYELKMHATMKDGLIKLEVEFHNCHIVLTGKPFDFFFAFICAIKGKYLSIA